MALLGSECRPFRIVDLINSGPESCSAFCWTDCSRLLQKVVQCSFLSYLLENSFSSFVTFSWVLSKCIFKLNMVKNCRECTARHLLRNVNDICSITPAKLNDNRHLVWSSTASPSKQRRYRWVDPGNCDQQVYYILSTVIIWYHSNVEQNSGNWTECALTNGHQHPLLPIYEQLSIYRCN